MADRFKAPSMDWTSPGDMHNRFKLFKQKCMLIFDGPLAEQTEDKKVRMLLLWVGDKGLEIYNTSTFAAEGDNLKITPVFGKLEGYAKPQSNQILARFQLRCLKQNDLSLEEFITKARLLIDDGGYDAAVKEETLRDTLVFGLKSDQVRRDAIKLGNTLTFKQVYDLAKVDESTKTQMEVITKGEGQSTEVHAVRSRHRSSNTKQKPDVKQHTKKEQKPEFKQQKFSAKFKGCYRCGGTHPRDTSCPAKSAKCRHCGKVGHFQKVCMTKKKQQQLHEIVSPEDQEDYPDTDTAQTIPFTVGTVDSIDSVRSIPTFPSKLFATVRLNNMYNLKLKIDTGADACILTVNDLQELPFAPDIKPSSSILKGYGGSTIQNFGATDLQVSYMGKTTKIKFHVVQAPPGNPSIIGCSQAQELGLITVNILGIQSKEPLTREKILQDFKDCFDRVGCFPGEKYHIQLVDNPKPAIHPPRSTAVHILPLYKEALDEMTGDLIITEVTEPTEWVNSIAISITMTKKGKLKVRPCLDPKDLNNYIKRAHYPTRTLDEILPLLHGKKLFTIIDTKKGYWHVELDYESSLLCTFNTPFGRYRFLRLPFGLVISQDVFQQKLDAIFRGIPNVTGIADDLIISGRTEEEHDTAVIQVLVTARENNVAFNSEKLQFKQKKVNFYGHTITEHGLAPAEDKLKAIKSIRPPRNSKDLHTILGMVTYLNRFSVRLAALTTPLRELMKKNVHFNWQPYHQEALDRIKTELCSSQIISFYDPDPDTPTILQCDASTEGLGAWIRQIDSQANEKIVGMASRSLTPTETRYSNIERETLAVVFGLEKFEYYLLGRQVLVETDHSPLEQIFKKNLAEVPSRLQRFILRCLKFDIQVKYKPGKTIPVADALSRVCFTRTTGEGGEESEVHFINTTTSLIDISTVREEVMADPVMNLLKNTVYKGWPEYRKQCPQELWDYWTFRCDLILEDGLVMKGDRIIIPEKLREEVLKAIHTGHQGETKCILLAREAVFWPGITNQIKQMVKDCTTCQKFQPAQPKMPILQPDLPTHPWEKLGTDIFEFKGYKYLIIVDYYSRFPVIRLLQDTSAETVCNNFKSILAEHGLPSTIIADCGPQYISEKFKKKCEMSNIILKFSSPYHHQANSIAERAVGTVKALWKKAVDEKSCPYTAIWMYRITPLDNNMPSPYELLYGRKPRSLLPSTKRSLQSQHPEDEVHQEVNKNIQERQEEFYNKKTGPDKKVFNNMEKVYVRNTLQKVWEPATILNRPNPIREPRTYLVEMRGKVYQRTLEHNRPRSSNVPVQQQPERDVPALHQDIPAPPVAPVTPATPMKKPSITNHDRPPATPRRQPTSSSPPSRTPPTKSSGSYEVKSQTTRAGRITQVPAKFKD